MYFWNNNDVLNINHQQTNKQMNEQPKEDAITEEQPRHATDL